MRGRIAAQVRTQGLRSWQLPLTRRIRAKVCGRSTTSGPRETRCAECTWPDTTSGCGSFGWPTTWLRRLRMRPLSTRPCGSISATAPPRRPPRNKDPGRIGTRAIKVEFRRVSTKSTVSIDGLGQSAFRRILRRRPHACPAEPVQAWHPTALTLLHDTPLRFVLRIGFPWGWRV